MKLFNRVKNAVPQTRRPNYDAIAQMEREFKMDDAGFDERYDEMLFKNFKEEWVNRQWNDTDEIEQKIDELWCELTTDHYRRLLDTLMDELRDERKWAMEDFDEECDNLRDRMIFRGKLFMRD